MLKSEPFLGEIYKVYHVGQPTFRLVYDQFRRFGEPQDVGTFSITESKGYVLGCAQMFLNQLKK